MPKEHQRKRSLCQQTVALLWKNILLKWRMKMQSFQELFPWLCLLASLIIITAIYGIEESVEIPRESLGQLDDPAFNITGVKILYTPDTKLAREVMGKIETISVLKGIKTEFMENEKAIEAALNEDAIGVVFLDDVSYQLKFPFYHVVSPNDFTARIEFCYNYSDMYCSVPSYWFKGFVSLQSSIDSALIEQITKHSVWDEMKSISGIRMRSPSVTPTESFENCLFFFAVTVCFSPFMYFLSQNVSREKRKLKEVMKTMGLRDTAFWLSWALVYVVYIIIASCVMATFLKNWYFTWSSFPALFLLFFIYGISSICLCFMISSLLKKPKVTSCVVSILIFFFGALSIVLLLSKMSAPLEGILSIFCPFVFGAGIAKIFLYQKYGKVFDVTAVMTEPYAYILFFDSVLYMLLALYFDKVVADKYGVPYSPFFFLKKSYWFQSRNRLLGEVSTNEESNIFNDNVEPMPSEFDGKEAIRLNNIKKTYKVKGTKTEALRGLSLNIYEGQITAVLGHSGAGKTTLLHILSGLSKPSDGSATIFGYNISERKDVEHIRNISAVCPQFNIQFECLTVKENLKTFAKIKGVPSSDIEKEVQMLLTLLDISAIQDTQASRLSGGQKRKLSLAITFLGEPQVLFLDEPTAGLDPYSRHQVWSLLNERKAGRVILFTTQFMDEADILANRKAFISCGKLTCVGSSLFLKKKWGIGYHLRMHINEFCDLERTTSLVKKHIADARLSGQRENELSYTLPLENVDKFPGLFSDMDQQTDLGIVNYGVTMTTLEDVFLKLEGDEIIDEKDHRTDHGERVEEGRKDEMEQDQLLHSDIGKATLRGMALWRRQVCSIARMHFLNLRREGKVWGSLLLLLGIILAPVILHITAIGIWINLHKAELHPGLYFAPGKQLFTGTSGLLILNDTGANIDTFIHAVESQNILLDVVSGSNISDQLVHNGAIKVAMKDKKYRFTLMCHMEVINCFPVLINIISNAFLQMSNSTARLRLWSHAFLEITFSQNFWYYFFQANHVAAVFLFPAFPPNFAMTILHDYKIKTWSQLRVSGVFPSAYWCGQALVDIPLHCILYVLVFGPWLLPLYIISGKTIAKVMVCLVSFVFGYSISLILFLYVIGFIFRKKWHPSSFWSFIFIVMTLLIIIIRIPVYNKIYLDSVLNVLLPMYPAIGFLYAFTMLHFFPEGDENELSYLNQLWQASFVPYLNSIILMFLLRYLVMKYGKPVMRRDPVFRISPQRKNIHQNPEEPTENDRDVEDERARAQSALASANPEEKPVVIVHNLRKEYKSRKICSCLKKNKAGGKVATRTVSFCVKKGEVLGLLGPNGAGKSTTISVITGDTDPTAGQVLFKGAGVAAMEGNTGGFLGYCPQENALWPNLTVKEHLEIYAAVKGIKKDAAAAAAVDRIAQVLELQEHLKKTVKTLAPGLARKLCFALSILGNPNVILFDEPTTGMDPKGKRQVWKAVHSVLRNKDQGAILTTHHMEEAEAVCDRVAIMVSGQLRCLGSIQYLKSKFGKNYLLQIKVKGTEQGEPVNTQILQIFPHAARQERISTLLVYKVPMEDALPLSKAFSMLEEAKQSFNLEEYSFSLNTLEQVFLEVCKEQERENVDPVLDTSFDWKHLQEADL